MQKKHFEDEPGDLRVSCVINKNCGSILLIFIILCIIDRMIYCGFTLIQQFFHILNIYIKFFSDPPQLQGWVVCVVGGCCDSCWFCCCWIRACLCAGLIRRDPCCPFNLSSSLTRVLELENLNYMNPLCHIEKVLKLKILFIYFKEIDWVDSGSKQSHH